MNNLGTWLALLIRCKGTHVVCGSQSLVNVWSMSTCLVTLNCIFMCLSVHFGTGELFFFGYSVKKAPHVTYKVADPSGHILHTVAITIPRGIMMHDFAITQDFAIFLDCPMVFKPEVSSLPNPFALPLLHTG